MTPEETIAAKLAAPFRAEAIGWKPGVVSGNRALALPYLDARDIQDRLDEVLGLGHWQDNYECLPDGSVICRLQLRIGGEWILKVDVGSPSEQPDAGDRLKAAFSDALKRAAVKFGIGRYVYRLPTQWVEYDAQKRRFIREPQLPPEALPGAAPPRKPAPRAPDPTNGAELLAWLQGVDNRMGKDGLIEVGEMLDYARAVAGQHGGKGDVTGWPAQVIAPVVEACRTKYRELKDRQKVTV